MREFALNKALSHFNIDKDDFMAVYNKFNYVPHSVEDFLFGDFNFVSESMPDKVINYVKKNKLIIDTSTLEDCLSARKEWDRLEDIIENINYGYDYGYDDDQEALDEMLLEQDELRKLVEKIPTEVLKIKETIKQLIS
jgi:hypothetical protein